MSSDNLFDPVLLDFSKTCRLCLHQSTELSPLFTIQSATEVAADLANSLPSKIMACVSIEVSTDSTVMPKNVCAKCIEQIDNWIKFKELCESTNTLLSQCLDNLQATSNDESENLKLTLHGPDNTLLSDMDVSILEDSLFNQLEDVSFQLSEDFNVSFSESLLSQKVQSNKKPFESEQSCVNKINKVVTPNQLDVSTSNVLSKGVDNLDTQTDEQLNVPSKWKQKYDLLYRKEYPCDICNKTFPKFTHLLRHDRTEHGDRLNDLSCPVCGGLFVSQARIDVHILKHREKTFECPECHKMMISKKSLSVHLRLHSSDNKFVCKICNAVKSSKLMLADHIRSVHIKEAPFRCELCGKMFKTKQSREKHQNRHLRQKLYKCKICGCFLDNSSNYNLHLATHSTEKNIVCDVCGKFFKTNFLLGRHLQTHSSNKSFECIACPRRFAKRYLLVRHEATHLDLHPFSCRYCDKTFKRKDFVVTHMRTHTGEKRHSCSVCFTAFTSLNLLKKHKCVKQKDDNSSKDNDPNLPVTITLNT